MTPDTGTELPARSAPWLLATSGVLAAFVLAMLWIGGARLGIAQVFAVTGGMLVVMAAGTVVLTLAGLHGVAAGLPVTFLVGTTATSAALLSLVLVTGVTAGAAFVGWAGVVAVALAGVARKVSWRGRPGDGVDTAVLAALAVLVGFWCRHAAGALPALRATGRLPMWTDYYIHGALIAQFGDRLAAGRGSLSLADNAPGLYHYGSYMPAAALAGVVDLPGLGLATSVWLPLGLLMAAIGSYALAAALADRRAGVIAVAGLGLLPDAASYGFANGFFGFHWVMFTVPGSGYALGSAAAALVLVAEWWRRRALAALVLGLALTALTFQLRAHVFLLLAPALALTLACDTGWARRRGRALAWAGIGAGTVVLALLLVTPALRTFWLERSAVLGFLNFVHQHSHPTAYPDLYRWLVATFGQPAAVPLGTALLIPVALGAWAVVYPAALAAWVWRAGWQTVDLFPLLLLAVFAALALFAPAAPHGDATEYQHRSVRAALPDRRRVDRGVPRSPDLRRAQGRTSDPRGRGPRGRRRSVDPARVDDGERPGSAARGLGPRLLRGGQHTGARGGGGLRAHRRAARRHRRGGPARSHGDADRSRHRVREPHRRARVSRAGTPLHAPGRPRPRDRGRAARSHGRGRRARGSIGGFRAAAEHGGDVVRPPRRRGATLRSLARTRRVRRPPRRGLPAGRTREVTGSVSG